MKLPDDLFKRCCAVLLKCDQFENRQTLCAVFSTDELDPFKYGIPYANNQAQLAELFLSYIQEQQLKSGAPALPFFLATLRDRYEGDARWDELMQLLEEIQALAGQAGPSYSPGKQQKLYNELLKLDFLPQVRRFQKVIKEHQIAAFLVHGPPEHGQRLLTRRLSKFQEEWETGKHVVIDAGSNGIGKSSRALWSQIARQLQLSPDTDKQILAEKVCEWWKTQNVIFVFYTVDYIPPDLLVAWMDEFWKPIAAAARQQLRLSPPKTHLLLFLVDFDGRVSETKLTLLDQPEQLRDSYAPLKLPPTDKIKEEDLGSWIGYAATVLPGNMDAAELIAATENGIPELVYEKICKFCGLSWEGDISL